jgi:hypothetical protein
LDVLRFLLWELELRLWFLLALLTQMRQQLPSTSRSGESQMAGSLPT